MEQHGNQLGPKALAITPTLAEKAAAARGWPQHYVLAGLVIITLVPRVLRAWQLPTVSPDGVFYLETAQAFSRGEWRAAFHELHLNTYPLILVALHRLGFAWETAAMGWNVLAATLTVLPLYGWMRRQYNARWALLGALLYAGHGEFIEQSPEAIREPTFWLLAALALYSAARAANEKSWRWTIAAITCVTLSAFTRVEGILFALPLVVWGWTSTAPARRWRLAAQWLAGAAALVVLWMGVQSLWFSKHAALEGLRTTPLRIAARWLGSAAQSLGIEAVPVTTSSNPLPNLPQHLSFGDRVRVLCTTFRSGLTPIFAVLLVLGCWLRRRELASPRDWPLVFLALGVTAGIWMHLWYDEESSSRYVLTIALISLPTAACACETIGRSLAALCERSLAPCDSSLRVRYAKALAFAALGTVLFVGWVDALWNGPDPLQSRRMLAAWVGETYGPGATVLGTIDVSRLVGYYAPSQAITLPKNTTAEELLKLVERRHPAVVLIQRRRLPETVYAPLIARHSEFGYQEIDAGLVAPQYAGLLVFARPASAAAAGSASPASGEAVATLPSARR